MSHQNIILKKEFEEKIGILEIEKIMESKNIQIIGNNLKLIIGNKEYNIGQDSTEFPRTIDEPFWRISD